MIELTLSEIRIQPGIKPRKVLINQNLIQYIMTIEQTKTYYDETGNVIQVKVDIPESVRMGLTHKREIVKVTLINFGVDNEDNSGTVYVEESYDYVANIIGVYRPEELS